MRVDGFLDRVFAHLPSPRGGFDFASWRHDRRPTSEGVGVLAASGVDVERMVARILDVAHYPGNLDYVEETRVVEDPAWAPPGAVRFYQRIRVPVLAEVQMELGMRDMGERSGWRVVAWDQLDEATERLDPRRGVRSDYNMGAWLLRPDAVGYALSSAPRRDDLGRVKYAALTRGADAGAARIVRANIEGMIRWSRRA